MTIEIDRLVMSILGSLEVVHLLLTNFHQLFGCQHRDRSRGSFHFFDSCDKNLMGVFIFFYCCDKNLIVLSRQLLIPLNSSKDDNSFVIIFLFLKFEIFVREKNSIYTSGENAHFSLGAL
jgi:hypothetical protein